MDEYMKVDGQNFSQGIRAVSPCVSRGPVLPENNEALREIARFTHIPVATGERMFSRWDFKSPLADGYVDIIQPDLPHAEEGM